MLGLITLQLIALTFAGFLYAYISRHSLAKAHRIFVGLIIIGLLVVLGCTVVNSFCWRYCPEGNSWCGPARGSFCGMGESGCMGHESCMMDGESCGHGGKKHHRVLKNRPFCRDLMDDSSTVIEKEVIIHNGDTSVSETRRR